MGGGGGERVMSSDTSPGSSDSSGKEPPPPLETDMLHSALNAEPTVSQDPTKTTHCNGDDFALTARNQSTKSMDGTN